jgi:hypothetical protein
MPMQQATTLALQPLLLPKLVPKAYRLKQPAA